MARTPCRRARHGRTARRHQQSLDARSASPSSPCSLSSSARNSGRSVSSTKRRGGTDWTRTGAKAGVRPHRSNTTRSGARSRWCSAARAAAWPCRFDAARRAAPTAVTEVPLRILLRVDRYRHRTGGVRRGEQRRGASDGACCLTQVCAPERAVRGRARGPGSRHAQDRACGTRLGRANGASWAAGFLDRARQLGQ